MVYILFSSFTLKTLLLDVSLSLFLPMILKIKLLLLVLSAQSCSKVPSLFGVKGLVSAKLKAYSRAELWPVSNYWMLTNSFFAGGPYGVKFTSSDGSFPTPYGDGYGVHTV